MRTLATKQPSNQDSAHQKPVRTAPAPVARSLSTGLINSTMLQRKPGCACGGGCPRCQEQALLQTKLKISEPGDQYEQEADRIADEVMRMPEPSVQRQIKAEEEEEIVYRKATPNPTPLNSDPSPSEVPPIVHEVLNSPGQPLEAETRTFMEFRFGQDFNHVRVHTDDKADRSAQAVNALAYTVGKNVVFASGQYTPKTTAGRKVLVHELTHVIQQQSIDNPSIATLKVASSDDFYEREAEEQAEKVFSNEAIATPSQRHDSAVQRLGDLSKVPAGFSCSIPSSAAPPETDSLLFPNRGVILSPLQKTQIENFVRNWRADGASTPVRVDGFASELDADELNWRLSCDRVQAVVAELKNPSFGIVSGIPASFITLFAQGETSEFGTADQNRRVTINSPIKQPSPTPVEPEPAAEPERTCGPDITSAISTVLSRVDSYFHGLSPFHKRRSCMVLDADFILSGVNPIMAWDTRELFLPNTGFLDPYFRANGCGSPRDLGCDKDPTRNLCETADTCGNTVVVGGKCMLAGTANYSIYGKMFKLCHDQFSPDYPRWDMRAMINLYKTIGLDDPEPPREMASSVFDGTFSGVPAAVENRGSCTKRCGVTHGGSFDFIWEPYKSR